MKVLITVDGDDISCRFDLTNEVIIAECGEGRIKGRPRTILLARPSAEELSGLVLKENIGVVICGAIEESHFSYLSWKNVKVVDSVIGPYRTALARFAENALSVGDIFFDNLKKESGA
ncbi:MAG: hypothetical protein V1706_10440 [Pseudomonadota bacterium]